MQQTTQKSHIAAGWTLLQLLLQPACQRLHNRGPVCAGQHTAPRGPLVCMAVDHQALNCGPGWTELPAAAVGRLAHHLSPCSRAALRTVCSRWRAGAAASLHSLHVGPGDEREGTAAGASWVGLQPGISTVHLTYSSCREYRPTLVEVSHARVIRSCRPPQQLHGLWGPRQQQPLAAGGVHRQSCPTLSALCRNRLAG
jgi:hypothetical protein